MAEARKLEKYKIRDLDDFIEEIREAKPEIPCSRNIKKIFNPFSDINVLKDFGEEFIKYL